jgi:hypothetical protein
MFETFRSRETIQAIYFDGSLDSGMAICRAFPSVVSLEFTGSESFLLRVRDQAAFLKEHTWCYKNDSGRLEWRDTEELNTKWEKQATGPMPAAPKQTNRARSRTK